PRTSGQLPERQNPWGRPHSDLLLPRGRSRASLHEVVGCQRDSRTTRRLLLPEAQAANSLNCNPGRAGRAEARRARHSGKAQAVLDAGMAPADRVTRRAPGAHSAPASAYTMTAPGK